MATTPPAPVNHKGEPLDPQADFFAPAPPEIGPVQTAHSTLKLGKNPWPFAVRLLLANAVGIGTVIGAHLLITPGPGVQPPIDPLDVVGVVVGGVLFVLILYATRFRPVCSYVGDNGLATIALRGSRAAEPVTTVFLFQDAQDLFTSSTSHYHNGIYTGTHYSFIWKNAAGKNVSKHASSYYSAKGDPKADHAFWIARSGERAWCRWLLDRKNAELDAQGYIEFATGRNRSVRVGRGFLEFRTGESANRIETHEIKGISLNNGHFHIQHKDARWYSLKGKFSFAYGAMANAQFFLMTVESLLGFKF